MLADRSLHLDRSGPIFWERMIKNAKFHKDWVTVEYYEKLMGVVAKKVENKIEVKFEIMGVSSCEVLVSEVELDFCDISVINGSVECVIEDSELFISLDVNCLGSCELLVCSGLSSVREVKRVEIKKSKLIDVLLFDEVSSDEKVKREEKKSYSDVTIYYKNSELMAVEEEIECAKKMEYVRGRVFKVAFECREFLEEFELSKVKRKQIEEFVISREKIEFYSFSDVSEVCCIVGEKLSSVLRAYESFLKKRCLDDDLVELKKNEDVYDSMKNKLVKANLRIVLDIAKRYKFKNLDYCDVVQEGNIGLIKAADKFDYKRNLKFATYATWWVRQCITSASKDKDKFIRIPSTISGSFSKIKKVRAKYVYKNGYEPTYEELVKETGISLKSTKLCLECAYDVVSFDSRLDEEGNIMDSNIEDPNTTDSLNKVIVEGLKERIKTMLDLLPQRERNVIIKRFGFEGGGVKTLEEVGKTYKLSKERVRQMQIKALSRLKHPSNLNSLKLWECEREEIEELL